MFNFNNVSYTNKLPEEGYDLEFHKLIELKNKIDVKIKNLENKIRVNSYMTRIEKQETSLPHIKASVYFSFSDNF